MGSRTTYYSLAKDRLKGNHPRIYNLILMLTLMSLTGTAAFLISDIFSFDIDYDDMSIQGGKGIIFPALWGDKKAISDATNDGGQETEDPLSAFDANSSPNKAMSSQSTSNSTVKDENGNASMELDSSKTSSATGAATGSIASAKKTSSSTSSKKSHSSSGSSSSSRSKSSSEKEEKAAVPDNESANTNATNQTMITQLPENRSDTLSTQKDNATAKEQSNKPTAGVYRNESPQSLIDHDRGDDPASGSKSLNSETAAAGTTHGMEILADDGGQEKGYPLSSLGANASPNETISSQSTSNSTGKDENGSASMELDSSQTSSATGQATGSIASAKKTVTSTSSKESHSSSGSSSSSRSKSSSEKEEKAAVPDNESANATATNQTSINHLPENRSDTLSTQKDNATAKEQSNKPTAGVYRNESPQSLIDHDAGDDPASGSKSLNSETAAAGTTDGMEILPDDEGSAKGNERQESRSVKRDELAKDRAERNEKVANERALSSKRGQRQSRIAGT